MKHRRQWLVQGCVVIGILSWGSTAFAWNPFHRRVRGPAPSPTAIATNAPTPAATSACDGMSRLTSAQAERANGAIVQNLAHFGNSLDQVPNAYQGHRLRFGSCTMAAALTQFNAFVESRHLLLAELSNPPWYRLGTILPRHHAMIFKMVGEADEAVENNFNECHANFPASAEGMAQCLAKKLGHYTCLSSDLRYVPCAAPKIATFSGNLEERREFLRKHFGQPDLSQTLPLTCPWDTRLVLGPPQLNEQDVKFEHVSAVIGRRLSQAGRCEILIRNSWGTCSNWNQEYAFGNCDNKGRTDDVWVEAETFLKRSGELTYLRD